MPRPVIESSPTNTRNPRPAASRPGSRATASIVPPSPATSSIRNAGDDRRSDQRADCGEASGARDQCDRGRFRIAFDAPDRQRAEAAADRDQRRLGAEHGAERQRCQGGERDAGQLDRERRRTLLEPARRRMATVAGERPDAQGDEETRERQQRNRPPDRNRVEPQPARQIAVQRFLEPVDQRKETVGDEGDGERDQRRQHERLEVLLRLDDGQRVGRCSLIGCRGHRPHRSEPTGRRRESDRVLNPVPRDRGSRRRTLRIGAGRRGRPVCQRGPHRRPCGSRQPSSVPLARGRSTIPPTRRRGARRGT